MTFALRRGRDPAAFLTAARPWLLAAEDEHALLWGLLGMLARRATTAGGRDDADPPLLLRLERAGATVGVALRTPPRPLILGTLEPDVAAELARRLAAGEAGMGATTLPGVRGPTAAAHAFAEAFLAAGGCAAARLAVAQRLHVAREVLPVRDAPGRMRPGRAADRDLVAAWLAAFQREALPHEGSDARASRASAATRLPPSATSGIHLWELPDGPVAMAGYSGPTPSGIRVNAVYTPPDRRGRGHATALVSALSLRLLERHERCYLFTDLANPTSNGIYRRLGYRPVTDWDSWSFEGARPPP